MSEALNYTPELIKNPHNKISELRENFPNIKLNPISIERNEEKIIKECEDLLALAELYSFEDKVYEIGVAGSLPEMAVDRGAKEPENADESGRVFGKLYQDSDYIWAENWDPAEELGLETEKESATNNFKIITK
jgi:hypothetical protein